MFLDRNVIITVLPKWFSANLLTNHNWLKYADNRTVYRVEIFGYEILGE